MPTGEHRRTKASKPKQLTPRQKRFVLEYMVDQNATQAAIRAGYTAKNADVVGPRMSLIPAVAAEIAKLQQSVAEKLGITVERVLLERSRLAFYDPAKAFDKRGRLLAPHKMDEDTRRAIAGVSTDLIGITKIRMVTKDQHLNALERHLGMNSDDGADRGGLNIHIHM